MALWKRDITSGLIILVPIIITIWVVYWLFQFIAGLPVIEGTIANPALRVIVTLCIFVLFVFTVGYVMRTTVGALVELTLDNMMNRVPGLRVIYNGSKVAIETAVMDTDELRTPVKIETWNNIRMTAFKTGSQTTDGKTVLFIPTSPNPISGYVIEVEENDTIETNEDVETALARIISAGFGEHHRSVVDTAVETSNGGNDSQRNLNTDV